MFLERFRLTLIVIPWRKTLNLIKKTMKWSIYSIFSPSWWQRYYCVQSFPLWPQVFDLGHCISACSSACLSTEPRHLFDQQTRHGCRRWTEQLCAARSYLCWKVYVLQSITSFCLWNHWPAFLQICHVVSVCDRSEDTKKDKTNAIKALNLSHWSFLFITLQWLANLRMMEAFAILRSLSESWRVKHS